MNAKRPGSFLSSIKTRLVGAFILTTLITLLGGVFTLFPQADLQNAVQQIGYGNLKSVIIIERILDAHCRMVISERTLLIKQLSDPQMRLTTFENMAKARIDSERAVEEFEELPHASSELDVWENFKTAWQEWKARQEELVAIFGKQEELLRQGISSGPDFDRIFNEAFEMAFSSVIESRDETIVRLEKVAGLIRDNADSAIGDWMSLSNANRNWQIFFLAAGFVVALIVGIWLSTVLIGPILTGVSIISEAARGSLGRDVDPKNLALRNELGLLSKSIQDLIEAQRQEIIVAKSIADGDYTAAIVLRSPDDELGAAINSMLEVSNETLGNVNDAVMQVTKRAESISAASQVLSQGAMETAASLEEISASIIQIRDKTKKNATSAAEADSLAAASRQAADLGYHAVADMIDAMKDIQVTGGQIAKVVKLIDDIAFQTNLLALNAAVEAARAGRHGKGFSVVADEVRNLAGRSAKAAKETASMVEATVEKLEKGAVLAERTDTALSEIVANVSKVADLFNNIALSSNEQSLGIEQIASGLKQIDLVTQQNTVTAGETAASAQSLSNQAEALRRMVSRFRLRKELEGAMPPLAEQRVELRKRPLQPARTVEVDNFQANSGDMYPGAGENIFLPKPGR